MAGQQPSRDGALERASRWSPFLKGLIERQPQIAETFVRDGADSALAAVSAPPDRPLGDRLRIERQQLALATALGDLAGELSLEQVTAALSDFADRALDACLAAAIAERHPDAAPTGMTILALGKLGSRELNYSSDVDLILLFDPETLPRRAREEAGEAAVRYGRRLIELMQARDEHGYVARVDMRLRPSPEVTPIALPVGAAISYYESSALPWERAAFIRARACAGGRALGERFLAEIRPFVWRRALDFGAIDEIRDISLRIRDHYAQGQGFGPGFDLKRGRGGIREAEFFTQVQQLVHGGRDPLLRAPATLDALAALAGQGRLDPAIAGGIGAAYRLLRTIEHRVQMIDDRQEHRLPVGDALEAVAGLGGYADADAMLAALSPHVELVGKAFDGLVSSEEVRLSGDPELLAQELGAMGWTDSVEVARRVADWRTGKARSLRSPAARGAFEAMLPALLPRIAAAPDPMRALNRFSDIVERLSSGVNFFRLLEARPALADMLALILAQAPALADQLARRPTLLDGLIDESSFAAPPDADALAARFADELAAGGLDQSLDRVRRLVGERRFALGVQLIAGHRDPLTIAKGYSDLAEAAVRVLAGKVEEEFAATHGRIAGGDLALVALGRFGGQALTDASDLDLIFLFDCPEGSRSDGARPLTGTDYYNRLASRIVAALSVPTAAGPLYEVDTRLRPQGEQGMLAVSLAAFEDYQRTEAWTWEHLALCRARALTGSVAFRARVRRAIEDVLRMSRDAARVRADAAEMRLQMARHKPPVGPLDVKLGPGGLIDLEFTVHVLQLTRGVGLDPRLELAIAALVESGLLDPLADPDLRLLSAFLVVMRLVAPGAVALAEPSRALVASLCGQADWDALVAALDEARARIATRWDKARNGT
ncbi:bifunctional [glutamine synthetase] adenylyltransferase/[glutamine synthetase]-adenylyl-L-tyrosine phosphorylase [Sphingomonas astaxanthinifaciens]|uniref:Glutamate-ammonia-ligase adenylyltransferase n=1 Tax=Sphingomonas astaxanthinifaciens DSM 22298 TaxID=1123267 RepID=A0ABQ5Z779_9SPHN|nr:bifunctional [glutamine synthetase] adenylyltransferase/[glutamine synthetase]-adenylyl-L-tyrosine phosphorylase [Sphingomonas astaxanthinifaciens]GLR47510.1 glutamate-ammonia-ligase adenylyltransferase [Sphingomonas astaxanthinifaciens DSM 22298]